MYVCTTPIFRTDILAVRQESDHCVTNGSDDEHKGVTNNVEK